MSKLRKTLDVLNEFGPLMLIIGFFMGIFFMIWMVPRTRIIDTIPATQECTEVTVYKQTQDFCKEVKDIR